MEAWEIKLAKMFKDRDNKPQENIATGKVIKPNPLTVSIGDEIILDTEDLVISSRIHELIIKAGDSIILIPTTNGQKYYALDKVGLKHVPDN